MAQGKERRGRKQSRGVLIGIVLLILAVAGGALWFLSLRDGVDRPVPEFSFELRNVKGASVADAASEESLQEGADEVRTTMDALYVAGFIDPGKWEDGTFPEALEQFDGGAAEQAESDLQFLTLGDESENVESIDPVLGTMNVRFLVDAEQRLSAAVATTRFVADGRYEDGGPLSVRHDGTYYLRPDEDGRWLIVGYEVRGTVKPGRRTAGPQPGAAEVTP